MGADMVGVDVGDPRGVWEIERHVFQGTLQYSGKSSGTR